MLTATPFEHPTRRAGTEHAMAVNDGLDRLRFPAPLPVGDRVGLRAALDAGGGGPVCVPNAIRHVYE